MRQNLDDLMISYASYHRDPRNKKLHFIGIPLVELSLFIPLGWFRFIHADVPLSLATMGYLGLLFYYARIDIVATVMQLPFSGIPLFLADFISRWSFRASLTATIVAFVAGWAVQLTGHYYEGRKPALMDNIMQVFNAPLFLAVESMFMLGWRNDLRSKIEVSAT